MPSQEFLNVVEQIKKLPALTTLEPNDWREDFNERQVFAAPEGATYESVDVDGVPCEWITPKDLASERVYLYLHGGGYVVGTLDSHRHLVACTAIAGDAKALNVDYRMGPEYPFPAAVDDAVTAYRFLLSQGHDPKNIVIGGDSAGGGLATATLLRLRDEGDALPAGAALLSPWTDLALTGESLSTRADIDPSVKAGALHYLSQWYLNGADATQPLASPIYGDLSGLPPLFIQVGTAEILYDDSSRLAERATAAGVEVEFRAYEDMFHVFQIMVLTVPESRQAVDEIGGFIQRVAG